MIITESAVAKMKVLRHTQGIKAIDQVLKKRDTDLKMGRVVTEVNAKKVPKADRVKGLKIMISSNNQL